MKRRDFTRSFGRTYDGPRLRNPMFRAPSSGKAIKYLVFGIALATFVGIPAVFVYAPFMRYDAVTINGLTTLDTASVTMTAESELNRRRMLVIPGRHLFFARKEKVANALDAAYHFESLALRREGRTLVIDVQERITEISWIRGDVTMFVDLAGIAVRDATPEALAMIAARRAGATEVPSAPGIQPTLPIIVVNESDDTALGSAVIDSQRLAHILAIDAGVRTRGMLPLVYILTKNDAPWLTLDITGGPSLMFDITVDPKDAFMMYDAFARNRGGDISGLLYIDLRFGNHVYSKDK